MYSVGFVRYHLKIIVKILLYNIGIHFNKTTLSVASSALNTHAQDFHSESYFSLRRNVVFPAQLHAGRLLTDACSSSFKAYKSHASCLRLLSAFRIYISCLLLKLDYNSQLSLTTKSPSALKSALTPLVFICNEKNGTGLES